MTDAQDAQFDPENAKLHTLAKAQRARNGAPEGAAVRDETGRTYVATTVDLPSLQLSALRTAIAMAVVSGAKSLEAVVVVSEEKEFRVEDLEAVADLKGSPPPRLFLASPKI
jgi:cytidine deaminase